MAELVDRCCGANRGVVRHVLGVSVLALVALACNRDEPPPRSWSFCERYCERILVCAAPALKPMIHSKIKEHPCTRTCNHDRRSGGERTKAKLVAAEACVDKDCDAFMRCVGE